MYPKCPLFFFLESLYDLNITLDGTSPELNVRRPYRFKNMFIRKQFILDNFFRKTNKFFVPISFSLLELTSVVLHLIVSVLNMSIINYDICSFSLLIKLGTDLLLFR